MSEYAIQSQLEEINNDWDSQIESRAGKELGELRKVFQHVVSSLEHEQGKSEGLLHFIGRMNDILKTTKANGLVQETLLDKAVTDISDPDLKKTVEVSGQFLIQLQRETSIPSFYSSGFLVSIMNDALTDWDNIE